MDDLVDFATGRSGRGVAIHLRRVENDVCDVHPKRAVLDGIHIDGVVNPYAERPQPPLSNVLGNAARYRAGRASAAEPRMRRAYAVVLVTNGSEVIPLEYLPRLFRAYY